MCVSSGPDAGSDSRTPFSCADDRDVLYVARTQTEPFWVELEGDVFYAVVIRAFSMRETQLPRTNISLELPDNFNGCVLMQVLTYDPTFRDKLIPEEECFISPVVQVKCLSFIKQYTGLFTLHIPHCLPSSKLESTILVRQWKTEDNFHDLTRINKDELDLDDKCFTVHDDHISMYTRSFSKFTCTVCENLCEPQEHVFICGELSPFCLENLTTVKVKCYLCSYLYKLTEFQQVMVVLVDKIIYEVFANFSF